MYFKSRRSDIVACCLFPRSHTEISSILDILVIFLILVSIIYLKLLLRINVSKVILWLVCFLWRNYIIDVYWILKIDFIRRRCSIRHAIIFFDKKRSAVFLSNYLLINKNKRFHLNDEGVVPFINFQSSVYI